MPFHTHHWRELFVYRHGRLLEGKEREEALLRWKRAEDPILYIHPSCKQHEVDFTGLPPHNKRNDD